MISPTWFDVDPKGLALLLEKRGKAFAIFELVQNALDTGTHAVEVCIYPAERGRAHVSVEDFDPTGFNNLAHAYTLFAPSEKKSAPTKRGRFNLGEKLFLSLCTEATITSTKGTVRFLDDGTRRHGKHGARDRGTLVEATMRMTLAEIDEVKAALHTLIIPEGVTVTLNNNPLPSRTPLHTFRASLATEVAGEDGVLRRTTRQTTVEIHEVLPCETAMLYELGIPIVETGDKYHVNIGQKCPLTSDRDNVPPAYLRHVRTEVLNAMHAYLKPEEASATWVREAAGDARCSDAAITTVVERRFGEQRVIADPSDREGTKLAVSKGYTVITGGALSSGEWENVKRAGAALPAGQVTPSPKPYDDGLPVTVIPREEWTNAMQVRAVFIEALGPLLLGEKVDVRMIDDRAVRAAATFGRGGAGLTMSLNVAYLGAAWFWQDHTSEKVLSLLIHEFGHAFSGDHLSEEYHDGLCQVGAKLAKVVIEGRLPRVPIVTS